MSDHKCIYSESSVCVECRLSAAFPSRGFLVLPVSKHPLDLEPVKGETRPAVSPCSKCFVLEEAPAMAPGSQLHVTRLEMREALVSWTLSSQGWAPQDSVLDKTYLFMLLKIHLIFVKKNAFNYNFGTRLRSQPQLKKTFGVFSKNDKKIFS